MNREELKEQVLHEIVKSMAKLGTCLRSKVGAIVVKNGRIIMSGYNGSPPGEAHCLDVGCLMVNGHCLRCTHAEANCVYRAAKEGISLAGGTIYVYGWLTGGDLGICPSCDMAAKAAGIIKTVIVPIEK